MDEPHPKTANYETDVPSPMKDSSRKSRSCNSKVLKRLSIKKTSDKKVVKPLKVKKAPDKNLFKRPSAKKGLGGKSEKNMPSKMLPSKMSPAKMPPGKKSPKEKPGKKLTGKMSSEEKPGKKQNQNCEEPRKEEPVAKKSFKPANVTFTLSHNDEWTEDIIRTGSGREYFRYTDPNGFKY